MTWPFKNKPEDESQTIVGGLPPMQLDEPPNSGAAVEVVHQAPPMATMYKDGIAVHVQLAEISQMQGIGFVLYDADEVRGMARTISELLSPLPTAIMTFVDRSIEEGVIDSEQDKELHLMTTRWNLVNKQLQHLLTVISQMYPVKGG